MAQVADKHEWLSGFQSVAAGRGTGSGSAARTDTVTAAALKSASEQLEKILEKKAKGRQRSKKKNKKKKGLLAAAAAGAAAASPVATNAHVGALAASTPQHPRDDAGGSGEILTDAAQLWVSECQECQ